MLEQFPDEKKHLKANKKDKIRARSASEMLDALKMAAIISIKYPFARTQSSPWNVLYPSRGVQMIKVGVCKCCLSINYFELR